MRILRIRYVFRNGYFYFITIFVYRFDNTNNIDDVVINKR